MSTWDDGSRPETPKIGVLGWVRVAVRGGLLAVLLIVCFPILLLVRVPESLLFGLRRPITPWITQFVCISALYIMNLTRSVSGVAAENAGAFVANHSSWLDIFVLNASKRIYFVSKAEVSAWPGIGWLARGTGTLFINRDRREAKAQQKMFEDRLHAGHGLMFFPEGTSTDGRRVLPFKTTLFAAFLTNELKAELRLQPISIRYHAPVGQDPRFYGWWGDMDFGAGLIKVLAASPQGSVEVIYHPPIDAADFDNRKNLAAACELAVRTGFNEVAQSDL